MMIFSPRLRSNNTGGTLPGLATDQPVVFVKHYAKLLHFSTVYDNYGEMKFV